ncbi:MAG: hypothetical protein JWP65_438 [Ramlibacter sp.]|jgi:catechol 2,3-dioxygenase-like lactoylglutathione lyase family enzyme|uniref:VOC family protein n=1 Tax=Ramlibacter sp. TaxID=1917967 RepID=UPI00261ED725|nr:VOC family protein [Ramlibacter sp.]MDB5750017.1 hypothetical protein [Ramlibacter sp.]
MARIRHIAILTDDQPKLANFYKTAFEMKEVHRHPVLGPGAGAGEAIYLSDGELNLAILPTRGRPEGLHHFGFQVDDMQRVAATAGDLGGSRSAEALPKDGRFTELFVLDPVGNRIDLTEEGWKV